MLPNSCCLCRGIIQSRSLSHWLRQELVPSVLHYEMTLATGTVFLSLATPKRSLKLSMPSIKGLQNSPSHALMRESSLSSVFSGKTFLTLTSTIPSHPTSCINCIKVFLNISLGGFVMHVEMQRLMLGAAACPLIIISGCLCRAFHNSLMLRAQNMIKFPDFFWHWLLMFVFPMAIPMCNSFIQYVQSFILFI